MLRDSITARRCDRAVREAAGSLERLRGLDEPLWTAVALLSLGALETAVGRYDDADRHLTDGLLAVARGSLDEARIAFDKALTVSEENDDDHNLILCLGAFAQLALAEGDAERAAMLAGAARGLRRRAGLEVFTVLTEDVPGRRRDS